MITFPSVKDRAHESAVGQTTASWSESVLCCTLTHPPPTPAPFSTPAR